MPAVAAAVGSFVGTALLGSSIAATIATVVTNVAVSMILDAVGSSMQKKRPNNVAERQADVLELTIGENPREAIFGKALTGGSLLDAFNYGDNNDWEVMVIALADHECDALEGFYVNDAFVSFGGDGVISGYNNNLEVYWRPGTMTQTPPSALVSNSGGRWTSDDRALGVAHVWVAYKRSDVDFPTGRPRFRWLVRGAKLYDPRKDSTVAGGSGSHRWGTPSTYEWSENARVCHYNYIRGVFTNGQLVVGAGRSAEEAPPDEAIADANICDEDVSLKAGGTEKRYRVGCVIRADEEWASVEEDFAVAMGGDLIERAGALGVDVGVAKTVVATFTDEDLIVGAKINVRAKLSRADLVNTIKATFVDPAQQWNDNSSPLRRDTAAITADGEARDYDLPLRFVTSATQAQRLSKIALVRSRLQRSATVTLGPRWCLIEVGDWVTWTSARYAAGASRTFQVVSVQVDQSGQTTLALREISSSVYAWTPSTDQLDPTESAPILPSAPGAATIAGFSASATTVVGGNVTVPAIATTWTAITDPTVVRVRVEYQRNPAGTPTGPIYTEWSNAPGSGAYTITQGLTAEQWRVRAVAETDPVRASTATSWTNVTVPAPGAPAAGILYTDGTPVQNLQPAAPGATPGAVIGVNLRQNDNSIPTETALLNSASAVGANALINSEFQAGAGAFPPVGWQVAWNGNSALSASAFARGFISRDGRRAVKLTVTGTPANFTVADIIEPSQLGVGSYNRPYCVPVIAGQRVAYSIRMAGIGCSGVAVIAFLDATGTLLSATNGSTVAAGTNGDSTALSSWGVSSGVITAPANSAAVYVIGRANFNGSANPQAWMAEPMIALVPSGQTVVPPYTPGPVDRYADQTRTNSAAGVIPNGTISFAAGGAVRVAAVTDVRDVADGDVLTWGPFDSAPTIAFDVATLPALAAGESYNLTITGASATGGTVRAKKVSTGGTLTTQTGTTRTVVNSNPGLVNVQKPTTADAYNNTYRFTITGNIQGASVGPPGEESIVGTLTLAIRYRTTAGGGLTTVDTYDVVAVGAGTASFTQTITISGLPAIGQHADPEFQIEAIARTYTGSALTDVTAVAYETMSGATESTATPSPQKVRIRISP